MVTPNSSKCRTKKNYKNRKQLDTEVIHFLVNDNLLSCVYRKRTSLRLMYTKCLVSIMFILISDYGTLQ